MAISPKCDRCRKELDMPGALVFSPPFGMNKVIKLHICVECWKDLWKWIDEKDESRRTSEDGKA
jgi:hypothetical protein